MTSNTIRASQTSKLVLAAMMSGLIIVSILVIRIPIPFTQGYINLSDGIIFIAVMMLGRRYGALTAAVGSMMGDIIGGFAMWAPWTFCIKGGMAIIMAAIISMALKKDVSENTFSVMKTVAMVVSGIFMVMGYFIAEGIMYGNWAVAALGMPWNVGQFVVGMVLAVVLMSALKKTALNRYFIYNKPSH